MNFSLAGMNAIEEYPNYNMTSYFYEDKNMSDYNEDQILLDYSRRISFSVVLTICSIGVPLNGIVIWLLGFQIKRNPFTVLILNLAIADFGFLVFMTIYCIECLIHFLGPGVLGLFFFCFFHVTYISGLFLLTAISVDRCVCVLFPIWHHCSRPKYLSSAVCASLWIISFLLGGILQLVEYAFVYDKIFTNLHFIVTAVFCLPVISISSVILFIKICIKSQQIKRRRLLVMILITFLCFIILTLPLYIYLFVTHVLNKNFYMYFYELDFYLNPSASLNSSVNPVIYFLVGRKRRARTRESIKVIFQRVFRED
ncbi:mas-related G-protein coupled receptor member H-like [Thamnophis elegans]|uniref:mas-related G-protein coupled receptor member H-like n=1 Tax=Thamnophis elegans TaxID=35005 RepID=UPI001378BC7A|nr:mas-related G-protein coupled receptor member H-like [Thamnophis elegans]